MNQRNRRTRRMQPGLEFLEGRAVLSSVSPGAAIHSTALVQGTTYLFLNGEARGAFRQKSVNPDIGVTFVLAGAGRVTPLGAVRLSGSLQGTGFIRPPGHAGGTIQLSNARGSVTLRLEGPPQGGFTPPPSATYQFSVESGTGAYAHTVGTGTADIAFKGRSFTVTFHGAPNHF
jgi:hypothetical protein